MTTLWVTLKSICKVCFLKWKLVFLFSNFPNGNQMDENFANMRSLIQILDQTLYDTIQKNGDFSHFYFCYRYVRWYFKVMICHPLHRLWHWKIFQSNKAETFTALFITLSCWNVNPKTQKRIENPHLLTCVKTIQNSTYGIILDCFNMHEIRLDFSFLKSLDYLSIIFFITFYWL